MTDRFRVFGSSVVLASVVALAGCSDSGDSVVVGGGGTDSSGGDGSGLNADARLVPISDDSVFFDAWREALAGEFQRYDIVQAQDGSVVAVDEESVAGAADTAGFDAPQAEASADLSQPLTFRNKVLMRLIWSRTMASFCMCCSRIQTIVIFASYQ